MYYNLELGLCIEFGPVRRDSVSWGAPPGSNPPCAVAVWVQILFCAEQQHMRSKTGSNEQRKRNETVISNPLSYFIFNQCCNAVGTNNMLSSCLSRLGLTPCGPLSFPSRRFATFRSPPRISFFLWDKCRLCKTVLNLLAWFPTYATNSSRFLGSRILCTQEMTGGSNSRPCSRAAQLRFTLRSRFACLSRAITPRIIFSLRPQCMSDFGKLCCAAEQLEPQR